MFSVSKHMCFKHSWAVFGIRGSGTAAGVPLCSGLRLVVLRLVFGVFRLCLVVFSLCLVVFSLCLVMFSLCLVVFGLCFLLL